MTESLRIAGGYPAGRHGDPNGVTLVLKLNRAVTPGEAIAAAQTASGTIVDWEYGFSGVSVESGSDEIGQQLVHVDGVAGRLEAIDAELQRISDLGQHIDAATGENELRALDVLNAYLERKN